MKRFSTSLIIIIAQVVACSLSLASEVHLAIAPFVSGPKDIPIYAEDTANFYGTNIAIISSNLLRERAEAQLGKKVPDTLHVDAKHVAGTSIVSVTASGAEDAVATSFLSALIDQFLRFKHEQKEKSYHDAIAAVDLALASAPSDCVAQLKTYRSQLVIASLLDTKPAFERVDY